VPSCKTSLIAIKEKEKIPIGFDCEQRTSASDPLDANSMMITGMLGRKVMCCMMFGCCNKELNKLFDHTN
jgi:hypothetical protein